MFSRLRYFILGAVALVIAIPALASIDTVIVRNNEFVPAVLLINEGDTVVWHNIQGTHDVHHTGIPSLFGNAPAAAPWFYTFVFDTVPPDSYHYVCTVHGFAGVVVIPHSDTVLVHNFAFSPAHVVINPGDTIVWHNVEGFHNVHHNGTPSLFGNNAANAPWFYSFVFNATGDSVLHYECQIHPLQMQGTVKVLQPSAAPERPQAAGPGDYNLQQNYPNPFNSTTTIRFSVPVESTVRISVLDVLGQTAAYVFSGRVSAGSHDVQFNAEGLPSGIYFYRLEAPGAMIVRTMNYLK